MVSAPQMGVGRRLVEHADWGVILEDSRMVFEILNYRAFAVFIFLLFSNILFQKAI